MNSDSKTSRGGKTSKSKPNPKTEEKKSNHEGLISTPAKYVSELAKSLIAVPYVGRVASVVAPVAGVVSGIAKTFGWNKPLSLEPRCYLKSVSNQNYSSGAGMEVSSRLALLPEARVIADVHLPDTKDYGMYDNYKLLPGLVRAFTQTASDDVGTELVSFPVSPCLSAVEDLGASGFRYTINHSNNLAMRHMYWRGSMKYKILCFAQPFVSTRIRVTWFPEEGHSDPSVNTFAGNYYSQVYDISGTTVISFSIPYLSDVKFKNSCTPFDLSFVPYSDHLLANGTVKVNVVNMIAAPTSTVTVDYALFMSCGEDMLFAQAQAFLCQGTSYTPITDSKWIGKGEGDVFELRSAFEVTFDPIHPSSSVFEDQVNFPNYVSDWRTYWHRYSSLLNSQPILTTSLTSGLRHEVMLNPGNMLVYHDNAGANENHALIDVDFQLFNNFFQFRRGSRRYVFNSQFCQLSSATIPIQACYFNWRYPIGPMAPRTISLTGNSPVDRYGTNLQTFDQRKTYECEIPYMSVGNFWCTSLFQRDIDYNPDAHFGLVFTTANTPIFGPYTDGTSLTPFVTAVGDDFAWVCPRSPGLKFLFAPTASDKSWRGKGLDDGNPVEGIENSETHQTSELTELADVASMENSTQPVRSDLWITPSYEKAEISSILSRWYQYHFKWSSADVFGTNLWSASFPEFWINSQPFVKEKLNNFQYMRGFFRCEFRINATKMHAGGLLVSWLPHYSDRTAVMSSDQIHRYENPVGANYNAFSDPYEASLNPCAYMDASNNISLRVDIPATTVLEFFNVPHYNDPDYYGWFGKIQVQVLSKLRNLEATATDVDVTVGIMFCNAELYGPTVSIVS